MPNSEAFVFKIAVLTCLTASISFCAAGLWPKQSSQNNLKPDYLTRVSSEQEVSPDQFQEVIIDQWVQSLPSLKEIQRHRTQLLNYAIASLVCAAVTFGVSSAMGSIH